jgi:hypothetical protein
MHLKQFIISALTLFSLTVQAADLRCRDAENMTLTESKVFFSFPEQEDSEVGKLVELGDVVGLTTSANGKTQKFFATAKIQMPGEQGLHLVSHQVVCLKNL